MIVDVKSLSLLVYQLKSSTGYDGGSIHWYNDKNNTSCLTVLEREHLFPYFAGKVFILTVK